jgi:exosortase/archaeosortase family protein
MPEARKGLLEFLKSKKYFNVIVSILLIFSGLDLMIVGQKEVWPVYLGILLLILGIGYLLFVFLPYIKEEYREKKETLASRFLNFITIRGRLQPYFPFLGILVIILDIIYNLALSGTPELLTFDTIVLLFGGWMVIHNFIPKKFENERDFVFMFLFFLVVILVIPLLLIRASVGDFDESVNFFSSNLLVPPVVGLLQVFGVPIYSVDGIWIHMGLKSGGDAIIGITTECSGIFSFAIFASAFLAFTFIEFERITKKVVLLMGLGIFAAYIANILRMTIIMFVGYQYDSGNLQNMLFAHANMGWIIFLLWISLFWLLMYKFFIKKKAPVEPVQTASKKKGVQCAVCGDILKVDVPGYRCSCGKFYHNDCIEGLEKCPNCGRPFNGIKDSGTQNSTQANP